MKRLFVLLLLLLLSTPVFAANTYFVELTGNDTTGNGSASLPWRSIDKCIAAQVAGDTCLVGDGTWTLSGTNGTHGNINGANPFGSPNSGGTIKSKNRLGAKLNISNANATNNYGFYVTRDNWTIQDFEIFGGVVTGAGASNTAIVIQTTNGVRVVGNVLHNIGTTVCTPPGVTTSGFAGIYNNSDVNTIVEKNLFYTIGRLRNGENGCNIGVDPTTGYYQNDHGMYIDGTTGLTIRNNIFYDIWHGYSIHIYSSAGSTSSNVSIWNNTFADNKPLAAPLTWPNSPMTFYKVTGVDVRNNLNYNSLSAFYECALGNVWSGVVVDHNMTSTSSLFSNGCGTNPPRTESNNTLNVSPQFTNTTTHDYSLTSSSPAINAGITLSGVTTDYIGTSRPQGSAYDIGAYEFVTGTANTYYVTTTGNDSTGTGTQSNPWRNPSKCVLAMVAGDTCLVGDGTYTTTTTQVVPICSTVCTGGGGNSGIAANGTSTKPITLKSLNRYGAKLVTNTSVTSARAVVISARQWWIIDGFEVTDDGGNYTVNSGLGGIYVESTSSSNITITHNKIHDIGSHSCNTTLFGMAGLYVNDAIPMTISDNLFFAIGRLANGVSGCSNPNQSNTFNLDQGIYGTMSGIISNNVFYDPRSGYHLQLHNSSNLNVYNNTFAGRSPITVNGQIVVWADAAVLSNVNIKNNLCYNPQLSCIATFASSGGTFSNIVISNNIQDTDDVDTSDPAKVMTAAPPTGFSGSSNIDGVNLLLSNPSINDFTLTASSPAVNAGTTLSSVTDDFLGVLRPQGSAYDIGAYEATGTVVTYYVSINGNDSNTCTQAKNPSTAKRTIQQGVFCLTGGDILHIGPGTFTDAAVATVTGFQYQVPSGTASTPTIIEGEGIGVTINAPDPAISPRCSWWSFESPTYLTIRKLTIDSTAATAAGCTDNQNIWFGHAIQFPHDILFEDLELTGAEADGFLGSAYNFTIRRVHAHHNGNLHSHPFGVHGMYISEGSHDVLIEDSEFDHNGFPVGAFHSGVQFNGNGTPIAGVVARRNSFHDNAGGGSYPNTQGAQYYDNLFYGNGSQDIEFWGNNTINNLVYNNTFRGDTPYGIYWIGYGSSSTGNQVINNIILNTNSITNSPFICYKDFSNTLDNCNNVGTFTTNLTTGPITNYTISTTDFHLKAGTAAVNTGTTLSLVTTDKDGITRPQGSAYDIGAYEFTGGSTYYVSTLGNNANSCATARSSGTSAKRNIRDGISCLTNPGDILEIGAGTFSSTTSGHEDRIYEVDFPTFGTSNSHIIVRGQPNYATVIRTGGNMSRFFNQLQLVSYFIELQDIKIDGSAQTDFAIEAINCSNAADMWFTRIWVTDTAGTGWLCPYASTRLTFTNIRVSNAGRLVTSPSVYGPGSNGAYFSVSNSLIDGGEFDGNLCYGFRNFESGSNTATGTIIRNIKSHDNGDGFNRWGWDCGSEGGGIVVGDDSMTIINAVVYRNEWGISLNNGGNHKVYNATVTENTHGIQGGGSGLTSSEIRNTIAYNNGDCNLPMGAGCNPANITEGTNLGTNPLFTNATLHDYSLQSASVAINTGTTLSSVTTDILGITRPQGSAYDIGAYEFIPTTTFTYWAAPNGNDAGPCTSSATDPGVYLTIGRAAECAVTSPWIIYMKGTLGPYPNNGTHHISTQVRHVGKFVSGISPSNPNIMSTAPGEPRAVMNNINTAGTAWILIYTDPGNPRDNITIKNFKFDGLQPIPTASSPHGTDETIYLSGNNLEITDCEIVNTVGFAIFSAAYTGTDGNHTFPYSANNIRRCRFDYNNGSYIWYGSPHNSIFEDNTVLHTRSSGIQIQYDHHNNIVRRNTFIPMGSTVQNHCAGMTISAAYDINGHTTLGAVGVQIYDNIFDLRNCPSSVADSPGIHHLQNNSGILFANNLFIGTPLAAINYIFGPSSGDTIVNNIMVSLGTVSGAAYIHTEPTTDSASTWSASFNACESTGNCSTSSAGVTTGKQVITSLTDCTINSTTDYHHKSGLTPCKDHGTTVSAVTTDFDGVSRPQNSVYDLGPYEFVQASSPPTITTSSLPNGTIGTSYSQTLAAAGGSGALTWSIISGSLPTGLTLTGSTGVISGTPTAAGTFNFTVQVIDTLSQSATKVLSIIIGAATPATYYVAPSGNDGVSCTSAKNSSTPKQTIIGGLSCSLVAGDIIELANGNYAGGNNIIREVNFPVNGSSTAPITVQGAAGATVTLTGAFDSMIRFQDGSRSFIKVQNLIIDGAAATNPTTTTTLVSFGSASHDITLNNVTIKNAPAMGLNVAGSTHTFTNLQVFNNGLFATAGASGMLAKLDNSVIAGGQFYNNQCGGIVLYAAGDGAGNQTSGSIIRKVKVFNNGQGKATGMSVACPVTGGGIFLGDTNHRIENSLIYNNFVGVDLGNSNGGTVQSATKLYYSTVVGNSSVGVKISPPMTSVEVKNTIIYNNATDWSNTATGTIVSTNFCTTLITGAGCAAVGNPFFVDLNTFNLRLQNTSPAADIGTPISGLSDDIDGTLRPQGIQVDIGAYEILGGGSSGGFPGGFIEPQATNIRARYTPSQLATFIPPTRGAFSFPAPYGTRAARITDATDCPTNQDCVWYVGYSYWMNMNNHVSSPYIQIFLGLSSDRGGIGPALFRYDKTTEVVTKVGPLFNVAPYNVLTGEGYYWSGTLQDVMYVLEYPNSQTLFQYNVISKVFTPFFDIHNRVAGCTTSSCPFKIEQAHTTPDDNVMVATLRNTSTGVATGCITYQVNNNAVTIFPRLGNGLPSSNGVGFFDECNIDKSGRWVIMLEDSNFDNQEDHRIFDQTTGSQVLNYTTLLGSLGHLDTGYNYAVGADNQDLVNPNATIRWDFSTTPTEGPLVHKNLNFSIDQLLHMSHENAVNGIPHTQQFFCGSDSTTAVVGGVTVQNEVICVRTDGSSVQLVVAPVMTDTAASGGLSAYGKQPKGNIDITGRYFIWTANLGSNRLDAFIVKIPSQLLVNPDITPPTAPTGVQIGRLTLTK